MEKNLEAILQMYQKLSSEKNELKIDLQVAQKTLKRKEAKVDKLEEEYRAVKEQAKEYLSVIRRLKEEFERIRANQQQGLDEAPMSRLARPTIKGGGKLRVVQS